MYDYRKIFIMQFAKQASDKPEDLLRAGLANLISVSIALSFVGVSLAPTCEL